MSTRMQFAQQMPQALGYHNVHNSPLLNPPAFPSPEFASQMPLMIPGHNLYLHGGSISTHMQNLGRPRRQDDLQAIRSPLLDEFRNDKVRKWELKVLWSAFWYLLD